ncbi:MAG: NFACT RNA binding domain-containing protein [Erysipelotrichaceae bacterium]
MALDGLMLRAINSNIKNILPAKINKIQPLSDTELLFTLRAHNQNYYLLISTHSVYNRINLTQPIYTSLETPTNFSMVLRKHIDTGIILNCEQIGLDRILKMEIQVRNEIGDMHILTLYIELMGKYANLILVNEENKIIDAMKRIPPYENSRRLILPQATFVLPAPHLGKKDPFIDQVIDEVLPLGKQFHGFSPLFAIEMEYRMLHGESFKEVMKQVEESQTLYICEKNQITYAHVIELTHLESKSRAYELMKGIDYLYVEQEEKVRIKQQSGDLFRLVHHHIHKNKSKLPKLEETLAQAYDCDKYREYGDLLFAYMHQINRQMTSIDLPSFENDETISIILNPKLDGKGNANKYYQKYHKAKRAQSIVLDQIDQTKKELEYFELLSMQLEQATIKDANEIRLELSKNGYMKAVQSKIRKKKKTELPNFDTYQIDEAMIFVGKNNLQNEYLTFHFAHKEDMWFHTQDYHGSHVILRSEQLNEKLIRASSMLAAWYSQGRDSSSIPVDYCEVKGLKKIPGSKSGLVQMGQHKTIYIDPDKITIEQLREDYLNNKK